MEIGLFPLICGWWLDICSLVRHFFCYSCFSPFIYLMDCPYLLKSKLFLLRPVFVIYMVDILRNCRFDVVVVVVLQEMFDATLKDREQSFDSAPGTTMFLHWLVGMVYVFYFASFILLLREVKKKTPSGHIFTTRPRNLIVYRELFACRCSGPAFCGFWET